MRSTLSAVLAGLVIAVVSSPAQSDDTGVGAQPTAADRASTGAWIGSHASLGSSSRSPVSLLMLEQHPEIGMGRRIFVHGIVNQDVEGVGISDRRCTANHPCGMFLYFDESTAAKANERFKNALIEAVRHGKSMDATVEVQTVYKRRPGGPWKLRYLRLEGVVSLRETLRRW